MRTIHASILTALMIAAAGCGSKDDKGSGPGPNAAASLEGDYVIVGGEFFGDVATKQEIEKESEAQRTITLTKDTIEMSLIGDKKEKLKYTIDASKSPAWMDITFDGKGEKRDKSETSHGIYKLEGDTLTFFVMGAKDAKNRPTEFKTIKPDPKQKNLDDAPGGAMMVTAKKKK